VAKINPIKVKQDADKLEKAAKFDQAILLYRQLVDDNPRDWNTIKKIGDLYVRLNRNREAIVEYAKVAEFYAKDGFLLKAIAIWKQINKLDPSTLEPYLNLADLYAKQGLMMEAKSQYQVVVDEYIKRGKMRDAGDVLKKMADIDPGDLKIRSKLADLYTREGNSGRAVEEHVAIADELYRKGHLAEALQVLDKGLKIDPRSARLRSELARIHAVQKNYEKAVQYLEEAVQQSPSDTQLLARLGEAYLGSKKAEEAEAIFKRLIELDPDDQESRVQIGRLHVQQGEFDQAFEQLAPLADKLIEQRDGDKAAALLQAIVQKEPSHVPTLVKLGEIYTRFEKDVAVVATYTELTEAYINRGQMAEAAGVLERLLVLEPQNQQHKTKLQFVRGKIAPGSAPPRAPAAPASAFSEIEEEEFDLSPADEAPPFQGTDPAATPAAETRRAIELSGPSTAEDREFIEEHLAEGRVFRKYGLVDKAADQFEAVVARFPDNIEARQELREVHKEKGQDAKAAEQCLALAEIYRLQGELDQAQAYEQEARSLGAPAPAAKGAPAAPAAREEAAPEETVLEETALEEQAAEEQAAEEQAAEEQALEEEALEEEEEIAFAEEEIPLEVEESGLEPPASEAAPASEFASFDLEQEVAGDLGSQFIDDEPALPAEEPLPPFVVESEPQAEDAFPLDEPPSSIPPLAVDEFPLDESPPPPPSPAPLRAAAPRPVASLAGDVPADLQKVLDEVDSYLSLGFVDDAREALAEVAVRFPGHPAVRTKLEELGIEPPTPDDVPFSEEPPFSEELPPAEDALPAFAAESTLVEEPDLAAEPFAAESPLVEEPFADALGVAEPPPEEDIPFEEPSPLAGLGELPAPEPTPVEPGMDLGAELGELFGTQSAVEELEAPLGTTDLGDAGLADIFKEFKKGVDKQLGKEDYDTRYNLGIAYKEMGLVDEAIAEFQLAAKDDGRLLECSSMLGICFLEKGMPKLAIKWFEKGLKAPGRSDEEYQGLRYDLAIAYEADGDADKALVLFSELYGQNANFRDVAAKVRELKAAVK
jgi:pilus assembly protein FimV